MKTAKRITALIFSALFIMAAAMPVFALTNIKEVKLTITEPAAGECPSYEVTSAEPKKYTAKVVKWYLYDGKEYPDLKDGDTFKEGKEYCCRIRIDAAEGYEFRDISENNYSMRDVNVTVNGKSSKAPFSQENNKILSREFNFKIGEESNDTGNFFENIINSIKEFFESIADFFRNLF